MKVNVGSENKVKIEAVFDILKEYPDFSSCEVTGKKADSEVSGQPKSLEETIKGAKNRAENSFLGCKYSFGLESGLMKVPGTKTGYMDVTCCAIYDGENFHLGLSSAFEYPIAVTEYVLEDGLEVSSAFFKAGLAKDEKIGSREGAIGFLTKNRIVRKEYTKQAIRMALIHLENKELY